MNETTGIFLISSVVIQCIFFIAFITLIFKLVGTLKSVNEKVNSLQEQIINLNTKVDPVVTKVSSLVDTVQSITSKVDANMESITDVVDKIKDVSTEIIDFVSRVKEKTEPPIMDTVNTVAAFTKGIKAFFDRMKSYEKPIKKFEGNYLFEGESESKEPDENEIDFEGEFNDINKELNDVRKKLEEMKKV